MSKKLLCVCYKFPPSVSPTAIRSGKILKYLQQEWQIEVITEFENSNLDNCIIHRVRSWYPATIIGWLSRLKLEKFLEWFLWPDYAIFWIIPATIEAFQIIREQKHDAIAVFMMPYSSGIVGVLLKYLTNLPLVLNLDDSPTCSDMHPSFPSWIHYKMSQYLEDLYIKVSDATIYVSQRNLDRVKQRQHPQQQDKIYLVRYGSDSVEPPALKSIKENNFQIVYTGGMNGWYCFYHKPEEIGWFKRIYRKWMDLGRYEILKIDYASSSPVFIGKAIVELSTERSDWKGKITLSIYGSNFLKFVVDKVLENQNINDVVSVFSPIPHHEVIKVSWEADLLFLTLPARPDSSPGGRISAKTYEYLMSDRPILAAIPKGENWDYLENKPGVWLVEPTDIEGMKKVISELANAKFSGNPLVFDRAYLHPKLHYRNRAKEFAAIIEKVSANHLETQSLT